MLYKLLNLSKNHLVPAEHQQNGAMVTSFSPKVVFLTLFLDGAFKICAQSAGVNTIAINTDKDIEVTIVIEN